MSKNLIKKNNWWEEVIDTPEADIVEENIFMDENFIKNKDLIRLDMNIIQFPIFSKNTKRKVNQVVKYYFNKNHDTYISVSPNAGDFIPGETEEKVFIALMQIMKIKGMPRKFIVTPSELRDKLGLNKTTYSGIISKSLSRLATTNYTFKNTLYSSKEQSILTDKIETSIFNIRTITLSEAKNAPYRKMINDKRVKTLYEIEFSEHFYNNIIEKGYMVYNGDILLGIETSTARTIYMLIEKLRFDKLYLKIDTLFLIRRIPLKCGSSSLTKTIKTLEKALNELVGKNLITRFQFIKDSTWLKSEIEIEFPEKSQEDKQQRFFGDRNDFKKILVTNTISDTKHGMIEEIELINCENVSITKEMVDEILKSMPSKARELKTMSKTIKECLEKYGYSKVEQVAKYMKKQKIDKVRSYFIKALENNWVEYIEESPIKALKTSKNEIKLDFQEKSKEYDDKFYLKFENLPKDIQDGIENYAYRDYIKECGMETKIQQLAFKGSRRKYICEYLEKYPEILGNSTLKEDEESVKSILTEIKKVKEMIENALEFADMIHNYSENDKKEILGKILKEVIPIFNKAELTEDKLNEIIQKSIEI